MTQDLETSSSRLPALAGSRQQVINYLLAIWAGRESLPGPSTHHDPRRVALEGEQKALRGAERDRFQAERARLEVEVLAEWRRAALADVIGERDAAIEHLTRLKEAAPSGEVPTTLLEAARARIASAEAEVKRVQKEDDDRDRVREQEEHERLAAEVAGLLQSPSSDPRLTEVEAELQRIKDEEAQLRREVAAKAARAGREILQAAADPEIIRLAAERLTAQHKWTTLIDDRATYLAAMCEELERRNFAASVIVTAVRNAAGKYDWMPSIKAFVDDCEEVARGLWGAIWLLESNRPELRLRLAHAREDERKAVYNELHSPRDRAAAPAEYRLPGPR